MKRKIMFTLLTLAIVVAPALIYAAASDLLLLKDIGSYKFINESKNPLTKKIIQIPGYTMSNNPGVVAGASQFGLDHTDTTYETYYESDVADLGVRVQVTQHSGSDSDKWLLHEVEGLYRNNPETDKYRGVLREINGNRIFTYVRGTQYNWISNNIVVDIRYTDLQKSKPEPLEVITAYLQKHPSSLPVMVMDTTHDVQWIKDEMDRRLWLCDKWFYQLQLGKVQQSDAFQAAVKSMNIFLDYREKYYGLAAKDEKNLLAGYLSSNNGTSIKNKLTEYKTWWLAHKNDTISIP